MPDAIPDLWPDYVNETTVVSPLAILRYQATRLRQKTGNLLEAEVVPAEPSGEHRGYYFDLIAPALNRYRFRTFAIQFKEGEVYPVEVLSNPDLYPVLDPFTKPRGVTADTQAEFTQAVQRIFLEPRFKSAYQSLLARSNEANPEDAVVASPDNS